MLAGCANNEGKKYDDSTATVVEIPQISTSHHTEYSKIFSSVEYIPLEFSEESAFGDITRLDITNDGDFIVFDARLKRILLFDKEGHFLNKIGDVGHGPKEYINPVDIAYDSYNNTVVVADYSDHSLKCFDLKGELLRKITTNIYFGTINVVGSNAIATYSSYIGPYGTYNYNIVDSLGSIVNSYEKIEPSSIKKSPYCRSVFSRHGEQTLCLSPYSDRVFAFSPDSISFQYRFAYQGEETLVHSFEDWINKNSHSERRIYLEKFAKTDRFLFIRIAFPTRDYETSYLFVKDLFDGNCYEFFHLKSDIHPGLPINNDFEKIHNNFFYSILPPNYFEDSYNDMKSKKDTLSEYYSLCEKLSQEFNPIIQVCKLK